MVCVCVCACVCACVWRKDLKKLLPAQELPWLDWCSSAKVERLLFHDVNKNVKLELLSVVVLVCQPASGLLLQRDPGQVPTV